MECAKLATWRDFKSWDGNNLDVNLERLRAHIQEEAARSEHEPT